MKRYALLLSTALGMAAAQAPTVQSIPATPVPRTGTSAGPLPSASSANTTRPTITVDPQLSSAKVTLNTGSYVGPLSMMLAALAKSAGYEVVFNFNSDALPLITAASAAKGSPAGAQPNGRPAAYESATGKPEELSAKPITFNFIQRPFNQVWPLLMDVYELQYEVIKVGDGEVIRIGQRPAQLAVPLRYISAQDAKAKAEEFFGQPYYEESTFLDSTGKPVVTKKFAGYRIISETMRVIPDTLNNRLIAGGTTEETSKIRSFIATIDIPVPIKPVAPANSAVPDIQRIYTVRGAQADAAALLAAQYPALKVTPVGQTGRLVITGPQPQVGAALALLAQVDVPAPAAQAVPAAPVVPTGRNVYNVKGQQADIATLLGAQYPDLKVTPVGQTGQLVLTGPQTQLDAALALLGQVDRAAPSPQATVQRVFQLVNASAEEVKATLEGTLARDLTQPGNSAARVNIPVSTTDANGNPQVVTVPAGQTGAAQSPPQQGAAAGGQPAVSGATIIADKRTNTLIVRGTSQQVAQIGELIPQLDQVVPQINVQVRIQEITETAARSLGVDWKIGFGGFNVSLGGGGLGASFDPTRSLVGFNIFPTLQALENQGFTKRVYDGNITMQSGQRSLGSTTATQNASSTAAASIKSGGRLEVNIPSQAANVASIQKQIDYGVNLDFFDPQVAPDGTVTLRVRGQVNNLAGELPTTGLPTLLNFTNSEAQSTITFKSGQTVLMSGLLGTTESKTNTGVPFLSSLPVIGAAFGKQATNRSQTQLLVIITGSVVK